MQPAFSINASWQEVEEGNGEGGERGLIAIILTTRVSAGSESTAPASTTWEIRKYTERIDGPIQTESQQQTDSNSKEREKNVSEYYRIN